MAKYLTEILNVKGKLERQDFGNKASERVLREPRIIKKNSYFSYTPGLGLFKKEKKHYIKLENFDKLLDFSETDAPFYLLSLAIEKFPRLTSFFDIMYLDNGLLSWDIKGNKINARRAFEKEIIKVHYDDGSFDNLCDVIKRNIYFNPNRYFKYNIGDIDINTKPIITWNERTKSDISNLSGLNSKYMIDELYNVNLHRSTVNLKLNKKFFQNLLLYNDYISKIYNLKKEDVNIIENIIINAYRAEIRGSLWVPVTEWRNRLIKNGIKDPYIIEEEILNSKTYRGIGYLYRERLLIETKDGAAGTNGLMGYAKHSYIKINIIEPTINGE